MARTLIEANAHVNATDDRATTPLHLAADRRDNGVTQMLIEMGADVNLPDEVGNLALHFAATGHFVEIVETLVRAGADIHWASSWGTPLDCAREDAETLAAMQGAEAMTKAAK
mmetsp:Transcript_47103/g.110942  ORF Transcript_47103/g.110942 Transcript_47103/m.110942 type:complete len:113 (+) Transcript_47103:1-339(+)